MGPPPKVLPNIRGTLQLPPGQGENRSTISIADNSNGVRIAIEIICRIAKLSVTTLEGLEART